MDRGRHQNLVRPATFVLALAAAVGFSAGRVKGRALAAEVKGRAFGSPLARGFRATGEYGGNGSPGEARGPAAVASRAKPGAPAAEEQGWARATAPRLLSYPKDHGAHPEFRTEWWYFTGILRDGDGNRFGYQLTFFRQGIKAAPSPAGNPWSLRDLHFAHFTVTDVEGRRFRLAERMSRAGPGLAGAPEGRLDLWLLDWAARMEGEAIKLQAGDGDMRIDLELIPRKPVVRHGEDGLSRKGPGLGQASYYVSVTDLETEGRLIFGKTRGTLAVQGQSWFDHEFGSSVLSTAQVGWDWFGLHLSDGRDLMIYWLRRGDGSIEPNPPGTLVGPDGRASGLKVGDIEIQILDTWRSPRSRSLYPSRWRIKLPAAGIELDVAPLVADQELDTAASTGIIYWEGAVAGRGRSPQGELTCEGYIELTGYAGSLGRIF